MAREATPVIESVLRAAVATVEADGPLKSMSALYTAVAAAYNSSEEELPATITPAIVPSRLESFGIEVKTQSGRAASTVTAFPVVEETLRAAVATVESEGAVENLATLHTQVAEVYNSQLPVVFHINPAIASARIKEFGIEVKTQGKKGRAKGSKVERNVLLVTEGVEDYIVALLLERVTFTVKPVEGGHELKYPKYITLEVVETEGESETETEPMKEAA